MSLKADLGVPVNRTVALNIMSGTVMASANPPITQGISSVACADGTHTHHPAYPNRPKGITSMNIEQVYQTTPTLNERRYVPCRSARA